MADDSVGGHAHGMPIVQVRGLHKRYGARTVVDDVSFTVDEGEIFGVLGPNGAGKTTTVECLEGLRTPDAGTVRIAGLDPIRDRAQVTAVLGVQLQESGLQPKLTVREALELYSSFHAQPADWRPLAEQVGLGELLGRRFGKLSGGQKQRLFIALSLVGRPRIVVFDELTQALDPRSRRDTWRLVEDIRRGGTTVLLVTHFMAEAEHLCDRLLVLDGGRVVALDTPEGLIGRSASPVVISFRTVPTVPETEVRGLPGAASVVRDGARLVITGTDETVQALILLYASRHLVPQGLRIVEATLDDAFLSIVGAGRG